MARWSAIAWPTSPAWAPPSRPTSRPAYVNDVPQIFVSAGLAPDKWEASPAFRSGDVTTWRDALQSACQTNATVRRKLTAVRSLYSYFRAHRPLRRDPPHDTFVKAPTVAKDRKTPGLSLEECRRLVDAPQPETPAGIRDRAMLAVLAYTGSGVGELTRLRVRSHRMSGGHRTVSILGKGGKERAVPLHPEAFERLDAWIHLVGIHQVPAAPLFPRTKTPRGQGRDGLGAAPLSRRAVEFLVHQYARTLGFDPGITVHSLRVTAITTARERGSDILDLKDFAGHSDPKTTISYIRARDRLSKSPAYVLAY